MCPFTRSSGPLVVGVPQIVIPGYVKRTVCQVLMVCSVFVECRPQNVKRDGIHGRRCRLFEDPTTRFQKEQDCAAGKESSF